jgi:hypothetical protein
MRWSLIAAVVLASADFAAAQTSTQTRPAGAAAGAANQTITMTGCVTAGAAATDPFTLSNATIGAATPGVPPAVGTTGEAGAGAPPPSSATPNAASAAAATTYRLSGTDMEPFAGQRVEISGRLVPATAPPRSGAAGSAAPPMRDFRVVSVRPIGSCAQ